MKKITSLILSAALLITLCACEAQADRGNSGNPTDAAEQSPSQTDFTETEMPSPFEYDGGDENANFYESYNWHLRNTGIPVDVFAEYLDADLSDFIESWEETIGKYGKDAPYRTDLTETVNLYSIIKEYDIPNEIVVEALQKNNELNTEFSETFNDESYLERLYSEGDIEILCSRDDGKVMEHFSSEYAIVIDGKVYTPAWIYTRSVDDYKAAGITQGMIEDKLELYGEFNFTAEAAEAFGKKLSAFTGTDISLDNAS